MATGSFESIVKVASILLLLILWPFAVVALLLLFAELNANNWRFGMRALLIAMTLVAVSVVLIGFALKD